MEVTIAAMRCLFSTLELVKALTDKKNIDPNALLLAAAIAPRGDQSRNEMPQRERYGIG